MPLPSAERAAYESRLGHDFSRIRIHASPEAGRSATAIGAAAYTVGRHIVFGPARFDPRSAAGSRLLTHELVHTIQQRGVHGEPGNALEFDAADSSAEREADRLSDRMQSVSPVTPNALIREASPRRIQRQPAEAEIEMPQEWAFAADRRRSTDVRYAKAQALKDAGRIRRAGALSPQDREEVNAKLAFFDDAAKRAYLEIMRPVLIEVTSEEIQMPPENVRKGGHQASPTVGLQPYALTESFRRYKELPTYIDNDIAKVSFFGAEEAHIFYRDGSTFELGLVPRRMRPPVVEVDYHTPLEFLRITEDARTKQLGFINELELLDVPPGMPYGEVLKTYTKPIDFAVQAGTGRVVPSRINMLTAPELCRVLLDSERRYQENVDVAVQVGKGGTVAVGAYAGAGGAPVNTGVDLGRKIATRTLSPSARVLAREMDALLARGGSKTLTVEGVALSSVAVRRRGSVLEVSRFMSKLPEAARGKGTGLRVTEAFEKAAIEVGHMNGAKTVTINVGIIINPGWRRILEARGYRHVIEEGAWIRTIKL